MRSFGVVMSLLPCALACTPPLSERLTQDTDAVLAHGSREFAGEGTHAAAELLAQRFQELGAEVTLHELRVPTFAVQDAHITVALPEGAVELEADYLAFSGDGEVSGPLVDAGDGKAGSYDAAAASGSVLLLRATTTSNVLAIYELAIERGAVGILWDSNDGRPEALRQRRTAWKPDDHVSPRGPIPALSISDEDASRLRQGLTAGEVQVDLSLHARYQLDGASAVVARFPGSTHEGPGILVSGHLDSWHLGANDNATSLAVLLELGRRLRDRPLPYDILLAAFPGQEAGFFGSNQFVRDLDDDAVAFAITLDMLAPFEPVLRLAALDPFRNGTDPSPVLSAFGASRLGELFDLQMPASEMRVTVGSVNSDQANFWDRGIPGIFLACLGWPEYHTAGDVPERVDWARLVEVTEGLDELLVGLAELPPETLAAPPTSHIPMTVSAPGPALDGEVVLAAPLEGVGVRVLASDGEEMVLAEAAVSAVDAEHFSFQMEGEVANAEWLRVVARTTTDSGVRWVPVGD